MKVMLIHQDLFMQGGQLVAAKLANGLFRKGHEVHVVVSKLHRDIQAAQPNVRPFCLDDGIQFHVLPHRRAAFNVFALARLLRRLKPDVVMPNVPTYNQCAVFAKIVGLLRVPIVYVEHCMMAPTKSRLVKFCLRRDRAIVCVSDGVLDFVHKTLGTSGGEIVRIYNPSLSDSPVDRDRDIHPCMRERGLYTFVSAGEMNTMRKGFDVIIRAFAKTHAAEPRTRLVLFGRGTRIEELRNLALEQGVGDAVVFAGFTSNPLGNMSYGDAFVFGSRRETFGLVLVEALSMGLSVVSADCQVGPREILKGGSIGQLVAVDDVDGMARAMLNQVRKEWWAAESFDPMEYLESTAIDRYEALLRKVCE